MNRERLAVPAALLAPVVLFLFQVWRYVINKERAGTYPSSFATVTEVMGATSKLSTCNSNYPIEDI